MNCPSKVPPVEQNQGTAIQTLHSSVIVPLQNALGASMASSSAPKVAHIGSTHGKVVISLPPAVMTPQLSFHPGPVVAASVASNQSGLILSLPPPPVHNTFICPTPIIKTSTSIPLAKGHGTLLKLTPNQYQSISQKPLSQFLLLPPGYVFASNSQMAKPRRIFKRLAPKRTTVRENRTKTTSGNVNTTSEPQGGPPETPTIQETISEERTAEEELTCDGVEMENEMENEVEECDERDARDLFLTLSESSGSPTPSIEDGNNMEMVSDGEVMDEEKEEEQVAKEKKDSCKQTWEEELGEDNSVSEVVLVPELQVRFL